MTTPASDYPVLSPYLSVNDAAQAVVFYKKAFGATERYRLTDSKTGKVVHAELLIEGGLVMLSEANPQWGNKSPSTLGGTAVTLCVMVNNPDAAFDRAVAAGAPSSCPRPINSTASAVAACATHLATSGCFNTKSKRSPLRKCKNAGTPWPANAPAPTLRKSEAIRSSGPLAIWVERVTPTRSDEAASQIGVLGQHGPRSRTRLG